jgi:hypothetical protein
MRSLAIVTVLLAISLPVTAFGAGLAFNDDLRVIASTQALADETLARAESFRQEIALEWFGEALAPGKAPTIISVELTPHEETGITWPIDHPKRKFHRVWLAVPRQPMLAGMLRHEMVHVLVAARFSVGVVPAFADEAAASLSDDPGRAARRREILDAMARSGQWPGLGTILTADAIGPSDETSYAVACSLAEYLLTRGDKPTFLRFAVAGKRAGWDAALEQHYQIGSVRQLQERWREWVSGSRTSAARLPRL